MESTKIQIPRLHWTAVYGSPIRAVLGPRGNHSNCWGIELESTEILDLMNPDRKIPNQNYENTGVYPAHLTHCLEALPIQQLSHAYLDRKIINLIYSHPAPDIQKFYAILDSHDLLHVDLVGWDGVGIVIDSAKNLPHGNYFNAWTGDQLNPHSLYLLPK